MYLYINKFGYFCKIKIRYKIIIIIFFLIAIIYDVRFDDDFHYFIKNILLKNQLIEENFFIIDSENLEKVNNHMYGYSITKKGILTDNYYKQLGYYEVPEPQGVYVIIRKKENEIVLNQDFVGSFGIYIYKNNFTNYFAISNSFLLLEEYLAEKQNISLNKDFADNLIISELCTPSIYETLIKEITKIPSNGYVNINIKEKKFKIDFINYNENSIPFESKEGVKIIDNWVDKWAFIIRSLKKKTDYISSDLSGGFDTRVILSILLNSGINLNNIMIRSFKDKKHCHGEDYIIANNISLKYGFKLNNYSIDNSGIKFNIFDSLFCTIYSKLGFHKQFYLNNKFFIKPRFMFHGGGEIRGYPNCPIQNYVKGIFVSINQIKNHKREFYLSSMNIFNRSINLLKKGRIFNNDFEISSSLYQKGRSATHDGKAALEGFLANIYMIQPLLDVDIKKIKFDLMKKSHDLISYVYIRFAKDLINFPFQGNRTLNSESIKRAKKLNSLFPPYKIKFDYNDNFYIDTKRISPISSSNKYNEYKTVDEYLEKMFEAPSFIKIISQIYDNEIYDWANEFRRKTNYFPFTQLYGLLSIAVTSEFLSLNKRIMKK